MPKLVRILSTNYYMADYANLWFTLGSKNMPICVVQKTSAFVAQDVDLVAVEVATK